MGRIFFILAFVLFCAYSEGCQQHCGSLHIPYPFGIGKGCSLEASFHVICNTSNDPPRAYLARNEEIEIIEITPLQLRVKMFNLVFSSFDLDGRLIDGTNFSYDLSDSPYSFSNNNWFTVIGCTDLGVITYHVYGNTFSTSCLSFCLSKNVPGNVASCSGADTGFGIGCCQARIHKGTTMLRMQLIDTHKDVRNSSFLHISNRYFHASYAFVGEKASNESTDVQPRLSDLEVNGSIMFMRDSWASNICRWWCWTGELLGQRVAAKQRRIQLHMHVGHIVTVSTSILTLKGIFASVPRDTMETLTSAAKMLMNRGCMTNCADRSTSKSTLTGAGVSFVIVFLLLAVFFTL